MRKRKKRNRKKQDRGIVDFMMVTHHFFHSLREWILEMDDPRNQSYITYTQADLGYMAILKNICSQYSMKEMEENFNKETCIDTLRLMSGNRNLNEMPHYDTLNYYLEKLSPECLAGLRKKMVTSLIRSKQFNRGRLLGKYWRIIFDGTGLFYFKEKHCANCLCTTRTTEDGKNVKMYYHKVLEAKIVLSDNVIISLGTEFIENESENGAPLAIIVCADHNKAWVRPFDKKQTGDIDASILTDHMMLQATELGLGTVWVCYFKPDVIKKEFELPDNLEPVNILVIG